jgi:UrcA family protein
MIIKTAATLAAAIGALGFAIPASANASHTTAVAERVSYADINLLTPEGQAELERRVKRAAFQVCQKEPGNAMRAPRADTQCYREARQQGQLRVAQVIASRSALGG